MFPSGRSFCFQRFYVQADSTLTQMSPEQSSFHRIIIETSIVEYKQIFFFVFSVDLINRFEFFNCNSVVSNRSGNGYSRHSVSIHFSCNVHMNPPTTIVTVMISQHEAFTTEPLDKRSMYALKRFVADKKRLRGSCADEMLFPISIYFYE